MFRNCRCHRQRDICHDKLLIKVFLFYRVYSPCTWLVTLARLSLSHQLLTVSKNVKFKSCSPRPEGFVGFTFYLLYNIFNNYYVIYLTSTPHTKQLQFFRNFEINIPAKLGECSKFTLCITFFFWNLRSILFIFLMKFLHSIILHFIINKYKHQLNKWLLKKPA